MTKSAPRSLAGKLEYIAKTLRRHPDYLKKLYVDAFPGYEYPINSITFPIVINDVYKKIHNLENMEKRN